MTQERTYQTMADKSIGKCSSGHWLPLKGDCDLCGASPYQKCRYNTDDPSLTVPGKSRATHGDAA
jgi:hypothetical protein